MESIKKDIRIYNGKVNLDPTNYQSVVDQMSKVNFTN